MASRPASRGQSPGAYDVILDIQMPELDGIKRRGVSGAFLPDIPIMPATAHTKGDAESASEAGMQDHIAKPSIRRRFSQRCNGHGGLVPARPRIRLLTSSTMPAPPSQAAALSE